MKHSTEISQHLLLIDRDLPFLGTIPDIHDGYITDDNGCTVLHHAALMNRLSAIRNLLGREIHPHVVSYSGETPADLARGSDHVEVLKCIQEEHQCSKVGIILL